MELMGRVPQVRQKEIQWAKFWARSLIDLGQNKKIQLLKKELSKTIVLIFH